MQRKNPDANNPWQNARIKAPAQRDPAPPERAPAHPRQDEAKPPPAQRRGEEVRVYGRNACLAVFARRAEDVRKVYLSEARIAGFKPVLAWCVQHRVGYRVVENEDLDRLSESQHHEGVCFEVRRHAPPSLSTLLQGIAQDRPALLIWLDGVGNPHNVGALLRSAANFGTRGAILPAGAPALSGAAMRVAEGGAEAVPLAQLRAGEDGFALLREAGFAIAATVPRAGEELYKSELPPRLALILGAEGEGMSMDLIRRADLRLTIPGTGAVESLNVSASAAVLFAEYWRQHH
ncbi:MAG: rRNA methyltransferase [Rudaea sp.]|nr:MULTISPECIES: TrmH family RNA methyltransferase [unclassified Rudaea]MBN8886673.1 rRNA methyltransferase [Rudaea sp.]